MRALVIPLVLAGCGDNGPSCGFVTLLDAYRNIWPGHIAVDAERVYYSDFGNLVGTHLVFRQPREGGQPLVIAAADVDERFGYGMAVHDDLLWWAGESQMIGYTLFATPVLGGRSDPRVTFSTCTPNGIAVDAVAAYAGSIRCDMNPSRVLAVRHTDGVPNTIWESTEADVQGIAAVDGTAYIATTGGLFRVTETATGIETETIDGRSTYHVVHAGLEIIYSTQEQIIAHPLPGGGAPRTLYTFRTAIDQPRAFAVDGTDLYIAEPPELVFLPRNGSPTTIVSDIGLVVTHMTARDGAAYWSALIAPGSPGVPGGFAGAVFRVARPCD
jgi:hypothetical protein